MAKYNLNVISPDMRARLEFMMNIYDRLTMSDQDIVPSKNTGNCGSLNGYIQLMQCAANSKKHKKSNKSQSGRILASNKTNNIILASHKKHKNYSR